LDLLSQKGNRRQCYGTSEGEELPAIFLHNRFSQKVASGLC
jgi:hypothetical protein